MILIHYIYLAFYLICKTHFFLNPQVMERYEHLNNQNYEQEIIVYIIESIILMTNIEWEIQGRIFFSDLTFLFQFFLVSL